jgi:DNA-binding response OmpR family regulator
MQAAQSRRVILVVDDHASLHETLHLILDEHFDVLDAQDGVTAVAVARTAPVDLVLLDILMPDVDGFQTLQKLLEAKPGLPVIVVSGLNNASTAATALRHGALDYVTKPFQEEMLLGVIREALRTPEPRIVAAQQALLALVGCDVRIVASLGAMLGGDISVQSYPDPPSAEALLRAGRPVLIVVDTEERGMDWLGRAALLLDRCASPPAVMLLDTRRSLEARFALGQRCFAIERPFRLAALLELVCSMLPGAPLRQPWRDARLAAVIETIAADCTTFRFRSVAARLGLSPSHLSRRFREAAGRSLTLYLTLVRVHAARHLIEHTDATLETVAARVGFHDASHLSRAMVRWTGRRPGEYRPARLATR